MPLAFYFDQHAPAAIALSFLEIISKASSAEEMASHVEFLPL